MYEYAGCAHLAAGLDTVDDVRPGRGLCYVSSGGDPVGQARAMAAEIAAAVTDAGLAVDCLAVDRLPYPAIDALRAEGFGLVDADRVLSAARKIKLPGEVALLREAMRRVAGAAGEMEARIEPGRSETEIWADFTRAFVATEGRYIVTRLLQSGARTFPYFQEPGPRKVAAGELVCFDTDTVGFGGYCVDFSRTYLCGDRPATAVQKGLYARAREQLEHNLALVKPGVAFAELAAHALAGAGGAPRKPLLLHRPRAGDVGRVSEYSARAGGAAVSAGGCGRAGHGAVHRKLPGLGGGRAGG